MEEFTKKDEATIGENELAPSSDEAGRQPVNSDLPDWYIDLVHQAMKRTGEDLRFYIYGATKKPQDIYSVTKASVKGNTTKENSGTKAETTTQPCESSALAFHKMLIELAKTIPQEELDKFPSDYTENLDYYLYDMPKNTP